jgi:hypothetical protein
MCATEVQSDGRASGGAAHRRALTLAAMARTFVPRRVRYEDAGTVDGPFDDDQPASHELIQSDAACAIPWRADGYEAIEVFLDPALTDRSRELCLLIEGWAGAHRDIDTFSNAVIGWSRREGLSPGIYETPPDDLSAGVVAIAFTIG